MSSELTCVGTRGFFLVWPPGGPWGGGGGGGGGRIFCEYSYPPARASLAHRKLWLARLALAGAGKDVMFDSMWTEKRTVPYMTILVNP